MTNKELAELLKISPSGLSLVINNRPGVADSTRRRVLEQLEELGYGDLIRKKNRRNGNLCFVIYKKSNMLFAQYPFFLMLMEGMENSAQKYGSNLLIIHVNGNQPLGPQLDRLDSTEARGAVVFAPELNEYDLEVFDKVKIPLVYVDNSLPFSNVTSVSINNHMGTRQAVQHLVEQGHKNIGYLRSNIRIRNFEEREKFLTEAIDAYSLELKPEYIYNLRFSEQESYLDFSAILRESRQLPTALVADDDTLAAGAHKAISDAGLRIPDDIAVMGFNNRAFCTLMEPQLTSVYSPPYFYGEMAIECLMRVINNEDSYSSKILINTCIAERESTLLPSEPHRFSP